MQVKHVRNISLACFILLGSTAHSQQRGEWMINPLPQNLVTCTQSGDTSNVRDSSSIGSAIRASLINGSQVQVLEEKRHEDRWAWYYIIHRSPYNVDVQVSGWVHGSLIKSDCSTPHSPLIAGSIGSVIGGKDIEADNSHETSYTPLASNADSYYWENILSRANMETESKCKLPSYSATLSSGDWFSALINTEECIKEEEASDRRDIESIVFDLGGDVVDRQILPIHTGDCPDYCWSAFQDSLSAYLKRETVRKEMKRELDIAIDASLQDECYWSPEC